MKNSRPPALKGYIESLEVVLFKGVILWVQETKKTNLEKRLSFRAY
ncbi:MAG: hypothetical protein Q8P07_04840 [bacterium]|nr:hypothetical protein [bacterium]